MAQLLKSQLHQNNIQSLENDKTPPLPDRHQEDTSVTPLEDSA
jgi:hypothetical protein